MLKKVKRGKGETKKTENTEEKRSYCRAYHQESFVSVDGSDENGHVITLAVLVLRPDFGIVLRWMRLRDSERILSQR